MANKKLLLGMIIAALVLGLTVGCKSSDTPPEGEKVELPTIYENGKFLDGVGVKANEYKTYSGGLDASLKKGKVTKEATCIEVTYAEGLFLVDQYENLDDGDPVGHYLLEFTFNKTLDLKDYDGLQIELESEQNTWGGFFINVEIDDPQGKTKASWKDGDGNDVYKHNLAFGTFHEDDDGVVGPNIGWFEDAWGGASGGGWSLGLNDFTHHINGMRFTAKVYEGGENFALPWKIKSVKSIKKP